MEGDISNKDDDILDLEREANEIKIHITMLKLDIEANSLIKRTIKDIWVNISQVFVNKWIFCEIMQKELDTYKSAKEYSK